MLYNRGVKLRKEKTYENTISTYKDATYNRRFN